MRSDIEYIEHDNVREPVMTRLLLILMLLVGGGCAVVDHTAAPGALARQVRWAVLPMVNASDTAQAGLRAEGVTETLLRARGITDLARYPAALNRDSLFEPTERKVQEEALAWARTSGVRYVVYGAVTEWRYKVGVDGEPAVGMTLSIADAADGRVLWSASGARTGWSRESLAGVAQKLMRELLASVRLE